MHTSVINLEDVLLFLFAAGVAVPLMRRLRISPVLGFLAVGLAIGPNGLGRYVEASPWLAYMVIDDIETVRALSEMGVVFLLFMIGLELSLERLWALRRLVFGLGGAQVVLTGVVIALVASMFDNSLEAAIVLGAGFALSSTAIVLQLLIDSRRISTSAGRATFAVLLFQDLAVLPILLLISAFGAHPGGDPFIAFGAALAHAFVAVLVIVAVGRLIIRPVFRFIGATESREMFLAFVLLIIIGIAVTMQAAGLSMALGAFLAGLLLAETEYRHSIEADIEPFKGLLLGLFFIAVGMTVDLAQIAARPEWLIASVFGLFLIKGAIVFPLARAFGQRRGVAAEMALTLGQGGEFAFLVVSLALTVGLIGDGTAQFMLIVTSLTMIATPPVAHLARQLAARIDRSTAPDPEVEAIEGHVVIAGYGRVGQYLADILAEVDVPYLAVDSDAQAVAKHRNAGQPVVFGDAGRESVLMRCGMDDALALVLTMDDADAAQAIAHAASKRWPTAPILARARDAGHGAALLHAGADHVVPETIEASLHLSERLLAGVGLPEDAARRIVDERRRAETSALQARAGKSQGSESRR